MIFWIVDHGPEGVPQRLSCKQPVHSYLQPELRNLSLWRVGTPPAQDSVLGEETSVMNRWPFFGVAVLVVLLGGIPLIAQDVQTGTITGIVNSTDGLYLAGGTVRARPRA